MTKSTFWDFSTTAASNTSIDGNDVGENCAMSGINNALRSLAAAGKAANSAVTTAGGDAYTVTIAPAPDSLETNMVISLEFNQVNTTTTPTLNLNGFGAATIVAADGATALIAGNITGTHVLQYDGALWRLLTPTSIAVTNPTGGTAGQILTSTGATASTFQNRPAIGNQVFSGNGTFTTPAATRAETEFKFTIVGGGGGGGGSALATSSGSGGGAGATAIYWVTGLTAALACTITVGASAAGGNTAGTNGAAGNLSSAVVNGVTVTANGGGAGQGSTGAGAPFGGTGGTAGNGSINDPGGDGGSGMRGLDNTGTVFTVPTGGHGGASSRGGGGAGAPSGNTGRNANVPGSGGGGGACTAGTGFGGGSGAAGFIIVEWVL